MWPSGHRHRDAEDDGMDRVKTGLSSVPRAQLRRAARSLVRYRMRASKG